MSADLGNKGLGNNDEDLAAEYVLGVLDADTRQQVSKRIENDIAFAGVVSSWEEHLSGLNTGYEEIRAPASAKAAIDRELFATSTRQSDGALGFLTRFRIPILIAVLVFAFAPRVMNYISSTQEQLLYTSQIASLEGFDVAFEAKLTDAGLTVTQSKGATPTDKDYELWLVLADGPVLSLGVISGELNREGLDIPEDSKFAISVEPIGGSPTGVATGPVVALGPLLKA